MAIGRIRLTENIVYDPAPYTFLEPIGFSKLNYSHKHMHFFICNWYAIGIVGSLLR